MKTMTHAFALLTLGLMSYFAAPAHASDATTNKAIVFVCLHGSVKSQMAAAHFNKIAIEINYWSDVPPPTRDYAAARDAIVHHIDKMVPALAEKAHPQETLQGVITAIDERNDRISVRLVPDNNSEFKVQDGLIFNAIRNGDRVEITVENVGGAKPSSG